LKEINWEDIRQMLQKENNILQEMLNETENMHLVYLDRDFNFVRVNEAYAKTCGYKPEEMIGKNHFDLYPNEENEAIFRRVRDTGVPAEFHDKPFVFTDQPERGVTYWDWTLKPVKDETGEVDGLILSLVETTERKKAEERIQNLAKFPSENPNPVLRIDKNGYFLYCNNAAIQLLKASKHDIGEVIPEGWRTFVHAAFASGEKQEFEEQIGERTFVFSVSPVTDYVNIYGHDITERKKADEMLLVLKERFEMAQHAAGVGVWDWDVKTGRMDWTPEMFRLFGLDPQKDVSSFETWEAVLHPEDREKASAKITEALKKHSFLNSEYRVVKPDGQIIWINALGQGEYDDKNMPVRMTGICMDVTERKKAEEVLQEQGVAISSAPDAVFSTDGSFVFKSWNKAGERLFGWTAEEVVGKASTAIFNIKYPTLNGVSRKRAQKILMDTGFWKGEVIYQKKDGSPVPVSVSVSLVKDKDDNVTGTVAIVHDISKRKRREEALRRSEWVARQRAKELERVHVKLEEKAVEVEEYATRMEALAEERAKKLQDAERLAAIGATAGMVGHDIRNPLQSIVGDLYLIGCDVAELPEGEEKESIKESVASIRQNVEYIDKIVQDLQDFARPLNPIVKSTNLEEIIQELLLDASFPENIDSECLLAEEAKEVVADPALLKRILQNLVSNAVQAMPEGGRLEIQSRQENNEIVISVEDSGVGIPLEHMDKLFTPLFTTKSKGQGFGLAVVKRITEALGGMVTFESEVGRGTKFIVSLPVTKK
jgi:PAS domain S-box-containing protein